MCYSEAMYTSRIVSSSIILAVGLFALPVRADLTLSETNIVFAPPAQAREILTARDDFIQNQSPFERRLRMNAHADVTEEEYLAFVAEQVLPWEEQDIATVTRAVEMVRPRFEEFSLPLPDTVHLIVTTGEEECHCAYTRNAAIILPQRWIRRGIRRNIQTPSDADTAPFISGVVAHELFHIFSRKNPEVRDRLYEAIGFVNCGPVELPPDLKTRTITNPDVPVTQHCTRVQHEDQLVWAVPILVLEEGWEPERDDDIFLRHMEFKLLVVQEMAALQAKPVAVNGGVRLVSPNDTQGFWDASSNHATHEQPEEVLAYNFEALIRNEKPPSPEVAKKIEEVLTAEAKADN